MVRRRGGLVVFAVVRSYGGLRRHVPASRRQLVAAMAARQQVPAVADLRDPGARSALRHPCRAHARSSGASDFDRTACSSCSGRPRCSSTSSHRLAFEVPATYFGLRGAGDLSTTYAVAVVAIVALYPACLWYRGFKAAHPDSFLKTYRAESLATLLGARMQCKVTGVPGVSARSASPGSAWSRAAQ